LSDLQKIVAGAENKGPNPYAVFLHQRHRLGCVMAGQFVPTLMELLQETLSRLETTQELKPDDPVLLEVKGSIARAIAELTVAKFRASKAANGKWRDKLRISADFGGLMKKKIRIHPRESVVNSCFRSLGGRTGRVPWTSRGAKAMNLNRDSISRLLPRKSYANRTTPSSVSDILPSLRQGVWMVARFAPDVIVVLQDTLKQLEKSQELRPDDPVLLELKSSITRTIAELQLKRDRKSYAAWEISTCSKLCGKREFLSRIGEDGAKWR
jgi:hypothetical protein